jgi:ATP-dependent RNA helicase RhlE
MLFEELNLIAPLLAAVQKQGYAVPTPIQEKAIPPALSGRDVLGCAQTGTGKTAAFALPILQRLYATGSNNGKRPIRALVITPTRELASQVAESFHAYGANTGLRQTVVYGGVGQDPQVRALTRGVDVLVATPGRLLDLWEQGHVNLRSVEFLVLDEADRMLDMGFIPDVRRIVALLPRQRQTFFFSATLTSDIIRLSGTMLHNPIEVSVTPPATTIEQIEQTVYIVEKADKLPLLSHFLGKKEITRALVFIKTKHGADKVVRQLGRSSIPAKAIHGNKSQRDRERALDSFKKGETRVLVATDIAARGLDIDDVSHVVNFDLPNEVKNYVHRIGRTGRAGATGTAITFCSPEEWALLSDIESLIHRRITIAQEHPFRSTRTHWIEKPEDKKQNSANAPLPGVSYKRKRGSGRLIPTRWV